MVPSPGSQVEGPPSGRPWSHHTAKKRAAILAAAVKVFVRDGFSAASVDEITTLAGVGKQTVYNYFGDKQQLFLAAIQRSGHEPADASRPVPPDPADLFPPDDDPSDVLTRLGQRILDAVLDPDRAALHRLTIAELERHPELQQMWSDTASGEIITALARYLSQLTEQGRLTVADPDLTARQFAILVAAEGRTRSLHGLRQLKAAERRQIAHQTTGLIIHASQPTHDEEGRPRPVAAQEVTTTP